MGNSSRVAVGTTPGVQFSSQQYGAAMEIEVGDGDKPEAIQQRIRVLYAMLSEAIDEQIGGVQADNGPSSSQPISPMVGTVARVAVAGV